MNMKKSVFTALALAGALVASAAPKKGDAVIDAGLGLGMVDYPTSSEATFTQRVGAEWTVIPRMINGDFSLAVGAYINNGFGGNKVVEDGGLNATYKIKRNDINFIPTGSFRFNVNRDFVAYGSAGIGFGIMHRSYVDKYAWSNASDSDYRYLQYGLDGESKLVPAMTFAVGVRYFLGEHWGLNSQFGVIATNLDDDWSDSYNLLSVGVSYRF